LPPVPNLGSGRLVVVISLPDDDDEDGDEDGDGAAKPAVVLVPINGTCGDP
jgi:hypothetical protein